jgi:GTP-binding protein HflX
MAQVQRVLADIGAADVPQVLVFNKFDKLEDTQRPRKLVDALEIDGGVRVPRVFVSALTGQGLDELREVISQAVDGSLAERLNLHAPAAGAAPESTDDAGEDPRPTGTQDIHS